MNRSIHESNPTREMPAKLRMTASLHRSQLMLFGLVLFLLCFTLRGEAEELELDMDQWKAGKGIGKWFVPTNGYEASVESTSDGDFVKLSRNSKDATPFGNIMRTVNAKNLKGHKVRLTARMRVANDKSDSRGQMWLRVDRPDQRTGSFDNMHDRPQ